MSYRKTWDLKPLLGGIGTSYEEVDRYFDKLKETISSFDLEMQDPFTKLGQIQSALGEAGSLTGCLTGANTQDVKGATLDAKLGDIAALFEVLNLKMNQKLAKLSDPEFETLLKKFPEIAFVLTERRSFTKKKMSLELESLVSDLAVSGHDAYTSLYYTFMGQLEFPLQGESFGLSQIENKVSDSSRNIRQEAINSLEQVLAKNEMIFAHILNNLLDFRLKVYEKRGWKQNTFESLHQNRLEQKTLDAMWDVISKNKAPLKAYLERKAKLLGVSKLSWCDQEAPLGSKESSTISWEKGVKLLLERFKPYPEISAFIENALEKGWVDVAVSPQKRAGGFCTSAPLLKESRILMTYMDSFSSLSTLAHELGHAFHSHVLFDLHPFIQDYPMNVAETASTLFETILADGLIKSAPSKEEKISLLDEKISSYLAFNMNIHSRYLFETRVHEERKNGFIPPDRLSEMMEIAQTEAFDGAFEGYFPHFWCYKMHFYFTDVPFYNWPYTFGYLFSLGIHALLIEDPAFEAKYTAFLRDTGRMKIEDLAQKHLQIDLTKPLFWEKALALAHQDINTFLELTTHKK